MVFILFLFSTNKWVHSSYAEANNSIYDISDNYFTAKCYSISAVNTTVRKVSPQVGSFFDSKSQTSTLWPALIKYTLIPSIPLSIIAILSTNPDIWRTANIHHFYFEMIAVILAAIVAFYCISRAKTLNDKFSLFIGIGFLVNASVDLMHATVSLSNINELTFLKYFIPQTWFAARLFLSAMFAIAIVKYSTLTEDLTTVSRQTRKQDEETKSLLSSVQEEDEEEKNEKQEVAQRQAKLRKMLVFSLVLLAIMAAGIAISSLFSIFPGLVLEKYPLHRPYELPPLALFIVALVYFYKRQLYKKNDVFYKGLLVAIVIDVFAQIIMSYSTTSFDTAHNVAHVLKDSAYFVNIIGLALSSVHYNVRLKESNKILEEREEVIRTQYEKLEETDKMKDEFINVAAHELRSPIQPILGITGLLQSKIKDKELRELMDVTTRNAKRLCTLTENILDVTKIESQSLKLNKEQFNLNDVIVNCINDITTNADFKNKENGRKIVYEPKQGIFVEADKIRVTQVISNLLSNALKFTEEGTISVSIVKEKKKEEDGNSTDDGSEVIVSVKDAGAGIHPEILPRLFSKFATTSYKGTGLGLFICKSIIEAHGGKIWAENNVGVRGATFTFSLPLIEQPSK
jgi:signal transduction histidine kinase